MLFRPVAANLHVDRRTHRLGSYRPGAWISTSVVACLVLFGASTTYAQDANDVSANPALDQTAVDQTAAERAVERTSVLRVTTTAAGDQPLAESVYRLVRSQVTEHRLAELADTPPLSLEDLQLAVGCIGETSACLDAVAAQVQVDALIVSTLSRTEGSVVLSISRYVRGGSGTTEAVRRATDPGADESLLGQIPNQLREVYGLTPLPELERPPASPPQVIEPPETPEVIDPIEPPREPSGGRWVAPVLLGTSALAVFGAGLGLGINSQSLEDEYAEAPTTTVDEIDAARDLLDKAERRALTANILYGVGGALAVTTVIVAITSARRGRGGSEDEAEPEQGVDLDASAAPLPGGAGLMIRGRF